MKSSARAKKIVQLCHTFLPNIGGIEFYVYRLARDAQESGFDSQVITSSKKETLASINDIPISYLKKINLLPRNPYLKNLRAHLGKIRPDVVHVHSIWFIPSLQAVWLKKKLGFKIVNTVHGVYPDQATLMVKLFLFLFKFPAQKILDLSDEIIVLSQSEKSKLLEKFKLNPSKISVIANGVDAISPSEKAILKVTRQVKNYILFSGRIIADKNPDILIKAFNQIAPENPGLKLVFVGPIESNYKNKLLGLSKFKERIIFVNSLDSVSENDLMASYYKLAKISVAIGSWEGLPTRVLESMAQGTPVIAAKSGGTETIVRDGQNGYLLDEISEECLTNALNKALGGDLHQMGLIARESANQFLWRDKSDRIIEIYRKI